MESTYYYCKCSICFENDSEMEFINCGDQYCLACLERYVEFWIREASWGLIPGALTCPVCGIKLAEDDWMPYMSSRLIQLWNNYQKKRKETLKNQIEIGRSCPNCKNFQSLIGKGPVILEDFLLAGHEMIEKLDEEMKKNNDTLDDADDWKKIFDVEYAMDLIQDASEMDILDFIDAGKQQFQDFLSLIEHLKLKHHKFSSHNDKDLIRLMMDFGRRFLFLFNKEVKASQYFGEEEEEYDYEDCEEDSEMEEVCISIIEMQLNFQWIFPFGVCDCCESEICLPCCKIGWFHKSEGQEEEEEEEKEEHKKCPRCFIAIEKEPEGCNEMRCNYCGMNFCWECGRKWSKDCGIYKCKQQQKSKELDEVPRSEIESLKMNLMREPEIGVPNVNLIRQLN